MKFTVNTLLIALLSLAAGLYLPWWSIAPVAFVIILAIPLKPGAAFAAGFTALFLSWGMLSWYISNANMHLLAQKIGQLFIKTPNPWALIAVTALIGGLVAGFAAMSAAFLRPQKTN
jgi:hypothetical protein